jgi:hypothetical protein
VKFFGAAPVECYNFYSRVVLSESRIKEKGKTMKRIAAILMLTFALSAVALFAGEWTGYIADAGCAGKKGEEADHASCAKSCIERGAEAVLVSSGKVYKLDKQDEAKKFAGEKVVLTGAASEDGASIKVEAIRKAE